MPAGAVPFPFGDCRVCADKATGVHYGVATCEGCKGFFKRSIPKADKYKCFYEGSCTLNPQERNRCKSCRFRRCLEVGMSIEGVKMGRIPKLEKERALARLQKTEETKVPEPQARTDVQSEAGSSQSQPYEHSSTQWGLSEHSSLKFVNKAFLETSKDTGHGNRCSSSDSGIDEDVKDIQQKARVVSSGLMNQNTLDQTNVRTSSYSGDYGFDVDRGCVKQRHRQDAREQGNVSAFQKPAFTAEPGRFCPDIGSDSASDCCSRNESFDVKSSLLSDRRPSNFDADQSSTWSETDEAVSSKKMLSLSSSSSSSSSPSHSGLPFYPTVIKELLNQVIETGNAKELQLNLVRRLLSESIDRRPESWIECFSRFGSNCVASELLKIPENAKVILCQKRKLDGDEDGNESMWGDSKRINQSLEDESFVLKKDVYHSEQMHAFVTEACNSGVRNISDEDVGRQGNTHKRSTRSVGTSEGIGKSDISCSSGVMMEEDHCSASSSSDKSSDLVDAIPGASCPERLKRLKKIEMIASRVPRLAFWDIPDNTLGSDVPPQSPTETEQCKKEIEAVLGWLKAIGHQFTEKNRLDLSAWEEELAGVRPVHPLNALTNLTQKDIGVYWEEVVACLPLCNFLILGLCSSIPGFNQLDQEDRAILMEAAYFDLWLILLSSVFRDGDCYLRLVCDARFSRTWMQVFMPEKLVNGMFHFAEELNACNLTPCEHVILCAIQLTSKEHEKMKNPKKIQKLHDYYLDLLAYQIESTHKTNHSRVLIKIFQLLPMLTPISHEQLELTNLLRVDQPPDVPQNQASMT